MPPATAVTETPRYHTITPRMSPATVTKLTPTQYHHYRSKLKPKPGDELKVVSMQHHCHLNKSILTVIIFAASLPRLKTW